MKKSQYYRTLGELVDDVRTYFMASENRESVILANFSIQ